MRSSIIALLALVPFAAASTHSFVARTQPPTTTTPPITEPSPATRPLKAIKNQKKCLDVRGAEFKNGTPVQIYDCNQTNAQTWWVWGAGHVAVAGTNYCLDAGSAPAPGVGLKIWQCYDNLPAQNWTALYDGTIQLAGKNLCVDLTNGVTTNSNQVQTWTCGGNNQNQIWV